MFKRLYVASVVAEFLGTGLLVLVALILSETTAVSYFIGTSVAVTVAALYMIFSPVSGAHLNPAVTFGMWTVRRISTLRAIAYIAAQMLAGLAALELFQYFTTRDVTAKTLDFNTTMFFAEMTGAAVLTAAFSAAVYRVFDTMQSGIVYGASYFTGIIIAATSSAALLNPAVAMGERSWNAVYVLGPLLGGLVGANLYSLLFVGEPLWFLGRRRRAAAPAASATTRTARKTTARRRTTSTTRRRRTTSRR